MDTCAWCRPFDKLSDQRIIRESNAIANILKKVDSREIEIIGSVVLNAEISMIKPGIKEETVQSLVKYIATSFPIVTGSVEILAKELIRVCAIDAMDALHLAVAIENKAEVFITTDDIILNKVKCISRYGIAVKNPCEV